MDREYIDLGLSVKWATMNIGADRIINLGSYFAWGETDNKDDYTWEAYRYEMVDLRSVQSFDLRFGRLCALKNAIRKRV